LICISNSDGINENSVDSDDIAEQNKVKNFIKKIVSANLVGRVNVKTQDRCAEIVPDLETEYDWNPIRDYFKDGGHPCRVPFDSTWNFGRGAQGEFLDEIVQRHFRNLQIATQFHRCCFTCFKYCFKHREICRFGFPWCSEVCVFEPIIRKDRDKKSRIRITVLPQRNNANLNGTLYDPLLTIAHGGNHDIQYIGNSVGAAEYVASYASKAEEPDKKMIGNIYAKKIAHLENLNSAVSDRQRLYAVGSAILGSSPVGSVQACYSLLGLKAVKSSRQVVNVNPLHRKYFANSSYIN
jgi:hypothetical protein